MNLMTLRSKFSLTLSGGTSFFLFRFEYESPGTWATEFSGLWWTEPIQHSSVSWVTGSVAGVAARDFGLSCSRAQAALYFFSDTGTRGTSGSGFKSWIDPYSMGWDGLPGGAAVKESACQSRKRETQVRSLGQEDPWRRAWQSTPTFLPGESHGAWRAAVHRVKQSWTRRKRLSTHTHMHRELGRVPFPRACPHKHVIKDVKRPYKWCSVITRETILQ